MLRVANIVLRDGYVTLKNAFTDSFPSVEYNVTYARRRFLQMPLACIRVDYRAGISECFLIEYYPSANYSSIQALIKTIMQKNNSSNSDPISKDVVKSLLSLCQSDRERECLRFAVFKGSGLSATQARKRYGFESMSRRSKAVEDALQHAKYIRESIDDLAQSKDHSMLKALGIPSGDIDSDSGSDQSTDDEQSEFNLSESDQQIETVQYDLPAILEITRNSLFNFFEIAEQLKKCPLSHSSILDLLKPELTQEECNQLQISYEAYCVDEQLNAEMKSRDVNAINGDIVTDSESDDASELLQIKTPLDDPVKKLVQKKRKSIKLKASRLKAKRIAEQNFLRRKVSRKVKGIVTDFPDIGNTIEEFVKQNNVGADQWRRTGVLTFDGNIRNAKRVTYERIRQHLQSVYKRTFSYGTTVQLCVARNKRRKSSARYKGLAQVTTRRARKGFQLRYNPDFHWSCALYRGLQYIELTDGRSIINVNRDDAAGFRLDTLATNKQYAAPAVRGSDVLTTHTDYVNRYRSVLQTTSYNFTGTATTLEFCAGVVKAQPLFPKSPAQHAADFEMLHGKEELKNVFLQPNGDRKPILCVRVDGASDEGPSHEEVQFFWTRDHILNERLATLVTTRSSGSSFLNRVELQNGCLSRGHSNLFIPSTLAGSCIEDGKINNDTLCKNLDLAIDTYISFVNKAPCGRTVIHLYKGADSTDHHMYRENLKIFLKGSKTKKEALQQKNPSLFEHFKKIWEVRSNHLVQGYPQQYIYYLLACFKPGCSHGLCQRLVGSSRDDFHWFPNGPPLSQVPLPVVDPARPWGGMSCTECKGRCAGHYLKPEQSLFSSSQPSEPPSSVLLEAFKANAATDVEELAKKVLLPTEEVQLWIRHLETVASNRRRGAEKGAKTRREKAAKSRTQPSLENDLYSCGVCNGTYQQETEEVENWIACDKCDVWFHWACVNICEEPPTFLCYNCE